MVLAGIYHEHTICDHVPGESQSACPPNDLHEFDCPPTFFRIFGLVGSVPSMGIMSELPALATFGVRMLSG